MGHHRRRRFAPELAHASRFPRSVPGRTERAWRVHRRGHVLQLLEEPGVRRRPGLRHTFTEHAKELIDELNAFNSAKYGLATPTAFTKATESITFYDSVIVFEKGPHAPLRQVVAGNRIMSGTQRYHIKLPARATYDGDVEDVAADSAATDSGVFEDSLAAISSARLEEILRAQRDRYALAEPFPHAVIDGFFPERFARAIEAEFPPGGEDLAALCRDPTQWATSRWNVSWKCFAQPGVQHLKMTTEDKADFGKAMRAAFATLKSVTFVAFLERLTGIRFL